MKEIGAEYLDQETIDQLMTTMGFVKSTIGDETVWVANVSESMRVNTTKPYRHINDLKMEVYKRVAYHRDAFLKNLDAILLFCLSDMQGFNPDFTRDDQAKRKRTGIDCVMPNMLPAEQK